ncbi:MAG: Spermidine N(1)-acetyltransferase (Diamine acetyltransferase) [Candidatus Falkowbacteria bacterium GW2011_GWC2_38_22]|uniref:Spermidine N(1)-acetyltransferase (Diamine acetyltransferase) n=1 Tax=Candidatus Falkowbacteria bacterium GW2011_GWE1_38_31 TaxID=1618638 RepID=A0A0G0MA43_9BACT|nr:MAG: Spermidine N(1)-acetyltransferase (Diamine acetyltransferase) [Candidatus Falkowbacteria bacterium GW2011_GWF2_38_1205]KKQ61669.1 MAG: Spermidine N(1)-acetyltransferase (Diamine acetyltransferase) [Candidatus Falkowbacteria bacterium GW2011_GWC2_38_22]KKQ63716.1 MAG: Spermidine N(1)-acetyltransferase (Diamine acetyltransferase) [Candidatus Falkowbacteria bacterium GW2011_GWF1_38_22]KKQ65868.1 MAG: Spermidine N(1)-acetyltransferase (Diamine acetyltransferase) [Candidatus Falkowbacteria ba
MSDERRIFLSRAEACHAEEILDGINGGVGANIAFFSEPFGLQSEQAYLKKMCQSETDKLFIIRQYTSGDAIGTIGLHEIDTIMENARLGIMIFPAFQNMVFEKSAINVLLKIAFAELKLNTVYINVPECDEYMVEVCKSLSDFNCDGILRGRYKLAKQFYDLLVFSAVKPS